MKRQMATAAVFLAIIFGLLAANLIHVPPEFSAFERRRLASPPRVVAANGTLNTDFASGFETYALDSFVWRDGFRAIKARMLWNIFLQSDNNGIYIQDGSAAKIIDLNPASVASAARKLAKIMDTLPTSANVYYSIIPDKGYFMDGSHPKVDYGQAEQILSQGLPGAGYISLMEALAAEDYYATDLHWRQEGLEPVIKTLLSGMGVEYSAPEYQAHTLHPFYGGYYGQAALPLAADTMTYLSGGWADSVTARYLDTVTLEMRTGEIYDTARFAGMDPYDVFLGGAQPLVTLENPDALTDKPLYIFRDSFSSSLAPLLSRYYSSVTLIDLRYLSDAAVDMLVEFPQDADVLFLYGIQVLSDSALLLVS